jgi:dihydropteroate synthase
MPRLRLVVPGSAARTGPPQRNRRRPARAWADGASCRLPEIEALGFPVLVGVSRKSLLGRFYDASVPPRERLFGTIAAHVMALSLGADILRVHDVRAHVEACRVADAVRRGRP